MESINFENNIFLKYSEGNVNFIFSTSINKLDFNISTEEGKNNINRLKSWFNLQDVGYLHQIHSDKIFIYDGSINDGDALIINQKHIGIGIFTADCVPVLLYDKAKGVCAAVHSGWKGTISHIVEKTIDVMSQKYDSIPNDIHAYIGPHIRSCCYEVGDEVIKQFQDDYIYKEINPINNRKLNLEKCIIKQLSEKGINEQNIVSMNLCTFCSQTYSFHSYRKSGLTAGRMFSFIYIE